MSSHVDITLLTDRGDERGSSFTAGKDWPEFLPAAKDLHITSLRPGHIRGNHYHKRKKEMIVVIHSDDWTLHWDTGPETQAQKRVFSGGGAVLITVEPLACHAVVNTGKLPLLTIGLTGEAFDPTDPDTHKREIAKVVP